MNADEHQRERMAMWRDAWVELHAEANTISHAAFLADQALAEFDKRFPAPVAPAAEAVPDQSAMGMAVAQTILDQTAELAALSAERDALAADAMRWRTAYDKAAAEVIALRAEVARLRAMVPTKPMLERDCLTLNDWKYRARYLESQWANCSHTCAVIQGRAERAEAEVARLRAVVPTKP